MPELVSEKKVLNESSPTPIVSSDGICPSGWMPSAMSIVEFHNESVESGKDSYILIRLLMVFHNGQNFQETIKSKHINYFHICCAIL